MYNSQVIEFFTNLIPMKLAEFDVVLEIDWLVANPTRILCDKNFIENPGTRWRSIYDYRK